VGLADSKTVLLNGENHDVFGDGTVVIKSTPGHTPGHQSLFLKLANTGNVLLSGDLYHYPEEITYKKVPNFDTDGEQTAKSREAIETFVKQNQAQAVDPARLHQRGLSGRSFPCFTIKAPAGKPAVAAIEEVNPIVAAIVEQCGRPSRALGPARMIRGRAGPGVRGIARADAVAGLGRKVVLFFASA